MRLRLVCFAHAGGGVTPFARWKNLLPPEVALCPVLRPGRENAYSQPLLRDVSALTAGAEQALKTLPPLRTIFLGHSLGALLAYELARKLQDSGTPPELLILTGRQAPTAPSLGPPLAGLPDARFIADLDTRYGGIPRELKEAPDLLELMLPILRADLAASESYRYLPGPRLRCPLLVCNGISDRAVPADSARPWAEQTEKTCEFLTFPGGHFFLFDPASGFMDTLRQRLQKHLT